MPKLVKKKKQGRRQAGRSLAETRDNGRESRRRPINWCLCRFRPARGWPELRALPRPRTTRVLGMSSAGCGAPLWARHSMDACVRPNTWSRARNMHDRPMGMACRCAYYCFTIIIYKRKRTPYIGYTYVQCYANDQNVLEGWTEPADARRWAVLRGGRAAARPGMDHNQGK